ncbi:Hypothetical protein FKW44_015203 [Caligus rogercresseyi]|uniref:Uncharacterized protein n=1 Tax=Caligus rogercresseyi TaxID=217165 RepID=A0A7T8H020_CALRO|nr:Hypothetical protein FKW44_015203 [Caligus rogercresseyi]
MDVAGDCRITPPGAAEDEVFSTDLDESALDDLNTLANALDEDPAAKKIKVTLEGPKAPMRVLDMEERPRPDRMP